MHAVLSVPATTSDIRDRRYSILSVLPKILTPRNRPLAAAFIQGEPLAAFPIVTVTLDPTLDCNARCRGCIEDTPMRKAQRRLIPWPRMQALIPELRAIGVRAVELYGGEPTFYPWFDDLVRLICDCGLRLAVVTNGSLLHHHVDALQKVRDGLSWLRISINAGTAETHQRNFRFAAPGVFARIFDTAQHLARNGLPVSVSNVVTRQNYGEIGRCARLCERAGASHLQLKPAVHPDSKQLLPLPAPARKAVSDQIEMVRAQRGLAFQILLTDSLKVVLEAESGEQLRQPKEYTFCPASLFRAVISPGVPLGQVRSCPYHRASPKHVLGTLSRPLDASWLGGMERLQGLSLCDPSQDCPFWCNHHEFNRALWAWRKRYESGERDVLDRLPVTDHPGDCWL